MNFINAATKKERTHVEEIIKSQPVMPHEGITATEIGICGKQNLFMDVYRPDNDAEKHPIIIDIHGGGLIAGRKEQNQNLATWFAKEGYLTFVPDYRLVPETNVFGQITDVINAFATVAECAEDFGGDLNQVFVVADSAGAFLACMASSILRYPVKMQRCRKQNAGGALVFKVLGGIGRSVPLYNGKARILVKAIIPVASSYLADMQSVCEANGWKSVLDERGNLVVLSVVSIDAYRLSDSTLMTAYLHFAETAAQKLTGCKNRYLVAGVVSYDAAA